MQPTQTLKEIGEHSLYQKPRVGGWSMPDIKHSTLLKRMGSTNKILLPLYMQTKPTWSCITNLWLQFGMFIFTRYRRQLVNWTFQVMGWSMSKTKPSMKLKHTWSLPFHVHHHSSYCWNSHDLGSLIYGSTNLECSISLELL